MFIMIRHNETIFKEKYLFEKTFIFDVLLVLNAPHTPQRHIEH